MFVRQSTYDKVIKERNDEAINALYWTQAYSQLQKKWNELVKMVNEKGGAQFLEHGVMPGQTRNVSQFSDEELRSLLQLVHPDKHDGKPSAVRLTQKINDLRA